MTVDLLLAVSIFALAVSYLFLLAWVKKALGLRADWKRRFDRMRELLGL